MSETSVLHAEKRAGSGSGAAGRLRRQGVMPAVIYGRGVEPQNIQLSEHELDMLLKRHAGSSLLVDLEIAGSAANKVLLKDVQHNPLTGRLLHADFEVVSLTERVAVEVPLEFKGTPVGVAQGGGTLEQLIREVELECLPTEIPESIVVDVSGIDIGDHFHVSDIQIDRDRYEILTDAEVAVATVIAPRVSDEAEEGAGEASPSEPELVKKKEKDEVPEEE